MGEETSADVASVAARGLADPTSLTPEEIRAVCGSALTQREPDRNGDGEAAIEEALREAMKLAVRVLNGRERYPEGAMEQLLWPGIWAAFCQKRRAALRA